MKIKKGDKVQALSGKDRGKQGNVVQALPRENKVIVAGINISKKHVRPTSQTKQGGIIDKDMPMPVSAVAIVCSKCGPTRIGYRFEENEGGSTKIRICRKCGDDL